VALGEHLRSHQHVGVTALDALDQLFPLLATARRITVDADDPRPREALGEYRLETLGAAPERTQVLVATARASL